MATNTLHAAITPKVHDAAAHVRLESSPHRGVKHIERGSPLYCRANTFRGYGTEAAAVASPGYPASQAFENDPDAEKQTTGMPRMCPTLSAAIQPSECCAQAKGTCGDRAEGAAGGGQDEYNRKDVRVPQSTGGGHGVPLLAWRCLGQHPVRRPAARRQLKVRPRDLRRCRTCGTSRSTRRTRCCPRTHIVQQGTLVCRARCLPHPVRVGLATYLARC